MSTLDRIQFVLVSPQHSGNIGAAARALKNMGFSRLTVVRPPRSWRRDAKPMASNAIDIIRQAGSARTLKAAVRDSVFIVGTTRRGGEVRSPKEWNKREAEIILEKARHGKISILFGNERTGLSREELERCDLTVTIPTGTEYPSLNLAQAVLIVAYELFLASNGRRATVVQKDKAKYLATDEKLDAMLTRVKPALKALGYSNMKKSAFLDRLLFTIKNAAKKSGFEMREVKMIEGLARRVTDLEKR